MDEGRGNVTHLPRPLANASRIGSATDFCMQLIPCIPSSNGGLDHAFHLVGDHFSDAAHCLFLHPPRTLDRCGSMRSEAVSGRICSFAPRRR